MAKLRKVQVTTGVVWVEAPDADLYVLCGCPADAVKHLMRRGLIVQTERDGATFETGPNAILLSDVMLQNGTFCNMAEFPVLQMLYRQGAILPGHPNNRGEKPLLIGLRDQVEAQLHYIYRGNYGLVTREEIIATGTSPVLADELMAMKLKFAFGKIRHPRELLDTVILGSEPVALKGGVTLVRTGLNKFEFRLDDESVSVDLTLPAGVTYAPPYTLGAHRCDRGYFSVIHSGEGDGWDPDRPTMASVLIFQGRIYLIDAGPNVQHSLNALGIGINEIEGIFHTHCHDDHFAGLTSLLRADRRMKYYATPLVRASVMKKLSALLSIEEDGFRDYFDVCDLLFDQWNDIHGLEVMPLLSPHPVETNLFVFRALWEQGYRSYAHFADIVSRDVLGKMRGRAGEPGISQGFYEKVVADYAIAAEIKKIDIGGGMIHGTAEDFRNDPSGKIILTHLARPLGAAEKEIGSGAPFGMVDEIIPGNTWLCAEALTETSLNRLAKDMPILHFDPGKYIDPVGWLALIRSGTAELTIGDEVVETLGPGDFFGEEAAIFRNPSLFRVRAATALDVYLAVGSIVRDVPVMRWKLVESNERRMHACVTNHKASEEPEVRWRDEYSVNIQRLDAHHKTLLFRAGKLFSAASQGGRHHEIIESLGFLVDYAQFHFSEEEKLMERYGCADADAHRLKHRRLMEQMFEMRRRFEEAGTMSEREIAGLLRDWVVGHILADDRRFARDLNARGIY